MIHLVAFAKAFFALEEHVNNENIHFTVVDSDTVKINDSDELSESINIRVFTDSQVEKIGGVNNSV